MKQLVLTVLMVWLAGCSGGTYKSLEVQYPTSPLYSTPPLYSKLNLEIISPKEIDKKELESFRGLIISQLQQRGIVIDATERRKLIVEIVEIHKDDRAGRWFLTLTIGGPWLEYTSNVLDVRVLLKDQEKVIEFKELQEFASAKNWEDMKRLTANRIADAVYFVH